MFHEPFAAAGLRSRALVRDLVSKAYPGLLHGMPTTHAGQINADLLAFVRG